MDPDADADAEAEADAEAQSDAGERGGASSDGDGDAAAEAEAEADRILTAASTAAVGVGRRCPRSPPQDSVLKAVPSTPSPVPPSSAVSSPRRIGGVNVEFSESGDTVVRAGPGAEAEADVAVGLLWRPCTNAEGGDWVSDGGVDEENEYLDVGMAGALELQGEVMQAGCKSKEPEGAMWAVGKAALKDNETDDDQRNGIEIRACSKSPLGEEPMSATGPFVVRTVQNAPCRGPISSGVSEAAAAIRTEKLHLDSGCNLIHALEDEIQVLDGSLAESPTPPLRENPLMHFTNPFVCDTVGSPVWQCKER